MKILHEKPPIWNEIIAAGMNPSIETTIFTYGDTIYVPSGKEVPDYLIRHEELHSKQQGDNPNYWWNRYFEDQYFRIDQEAKAYATQYRFMCSKTKDRNKRHAILLDIAGLLASPTYGSVITTQGAYSLIKKLANI